MRQRRHVNGNSNAMATPVEESGWGSGRTVPANITSTLKRTGPGTAVVDTVVEPIASSKREKRSGAATARRPQSSGLSGNRDPLAGYRPKRRVQSARGAGENYNRPPGATGKVTTDTVLQSGVDSSLPKIKPPANDVSFASSSVNTTAKNPHRKAPPSAISASGTDAVSQVQWAVKATSATVPPRTESVPEPMEMRDLRRLLRERYGEKRSVRQAFLTWDINKDGCLCADELQNMLKQLGFAEALGQKKVNSILQHVVEMPSGSLQYDDFCGFVFGPTDLNQSGPSSFGSRPSFNNRQATDRIKQDDEIVPAADPDCVVSLLRAKYESRRLHKVFRDWDIDKNGGVTLAEIESNLRRQGLRIAKPQLMKLFDTYDLNHDGRLLYDEFMRLVYGPVHEQRYSYLAAQRRKKQSEQQAEGDPWDFFRRLRLPEQTTHTTDDPGFRATLQRKLQTFASRLNDAYAAFDDDHSGNLSYRELCHGLQQLGLNLTEREFLHLATRVDTDGNGEISFKEFCDIFGGGDGGNRRRRSTPTGVERNERVEEQDVSEVKAQNQESGLRRRSAGTFNFAHLKRRTKIPTRCGRTPYASTKELIGNQESNTSAEFTTESKIYGNGVSCRLASPTKVVMTLGQEEKQRHLAANEKRLQRLHAQMEHYEAQARPLQDSYSIAQERRTQTLQRHQDRYHQRIEEQRPRCTLSPARKGIQRSHPR